MYGEDDLCPCAERSWMTVWMCDTTKTTPCVVVFGDGGFVCLVFILFFVVWSSLRCFFPVKREVLPTKGPSLTGVYFSQGDPSSVKNVGMCIKCFYSLFNSHTTVVVYNTVPMYSVADTCSCWLATSTPPRPVSPLLVSRVLAQIATKQEQKLRLWSFVLWM